MLKNKIQQNHLKDLIAFIKQFMNSAASYLVTRGTLQSGGTKWKVVIGRKGDKGAGKNLLLEQNFFGGKAKKKCFNHAGCVFFLLEKFGWRGSI